MKLSIADIKNFIADYDFRRTQGFLWPFLSDQEPLAKMRGLVTGDDDTDTIDCIRPFFQTPINPNSETFKILIACFQKDNADAKRLYPLFINLEQFKLVTQENYDKILQYGDLDHLILYVAELAEFGLLNQARLDLMLQDPALLRKMQAAILILKSNHVICEELLSLAERHAEPELYCNGVLWLKHAAILTQENAVVLYTKPNIENLVKALSYSLYPPALLNQAHFNLVTKSTQPRCMADLIVLLHAQRLENHVESLDDLRDPRGLWIILNSMEKNGLVMEYILIELLASEWLGSHEAAEILIQHEKLVWTNQVVNGFMLTLKNRDVMKAANHFFNKQRDSKSADDVGADNGLEMTAFK